MNTEILSRTCYIFRRARGKVGERNYHWRDNFFLWYLCIGEDIAIDAINKEEQELLVSQLSDCHKLNQLQAKQLWQPANIIKDENTIFKSLLWNKMEGNTSNRTGKQWQGKGESFDVSVEFYKV